MLQSDFRRYLVDIDSVTTHQQSTDYLVIGAGVAGLRAAIEASQHGCVTVVTKGTVEDSNTWHAQGRHCLGPRKTDKFESHIADTMRTGGGLSDEKTVDSSSVRRPGLIRQLARLGAAHSTSPTGKSPLQSKAATATRASPTPTATKTGKIIAQTLIAKARQQRNITIIENFFSIDLLTADNKCLGVIGWHKEKGTRINMGS